DPLRRRPEDLGSRRELQGARSRQSLRRRRELLPVERRREPRIDDHGKRAACRRPFDRAARLAGSRISGVRIVAAALPNRPEISTIPTMGRRFRWPRLTLGQFIGLCFLGLAALLLALLSIFYEGSRSTILLASEELMRQASRRVTERMERHLGD